MFYTTKSILAFVFSVEIVLTSTIVWLQTLTHKANDLLSFLLSIAGLVIAYYTAMHLRERWKGQKLDNIIKELEIKDKKNDSIK